MSSTPDLVQVFNPSCVATRIFWDNYVNTVAADALDQLGKQVNTITTDNLAPCDQVISSHVCYLLC